MFGLHNTRGQLTGPGCVYSDRKKEKESMSLPIMSLKEIEIQIALGSLTEEYRNGLCRYKTPQVSKGKRTCRLCELRCIHKGEEFYLIDYGAGQYGVGQFRSTINICKTCSWLPIQTINRIINEYNSKSK